MNVYLTPAETTIALWAIDAYDGGIWETWQEEGDVPTTEPVPRVEVRSSQGDWFPFTGSTGVKGDVYRLIIGQEGAKAMAVDSERLTDMVDEQPAADRRKMSHYKRSVGSLLAKLCPCGGDN